ncbi:MAG TPA: DUF4118 domain-containing protein [Xanthomonadales bacterium]|nr:DUF4118 domain-containing protein [Xanthomonadales bacterium]
MPTANARQLVRDASDRHPLIAAALVCAATSGLLLPLHADVDLLNVAMAMLLLVALIAARWGRAPAVLASVCNVVVFDVGFVPPRGSLHVHDSKYLIVFAVMFAVALLVSHFSGQLRDSERAARARESRQRLLYDLAEELNRTLRPQQVVEAVVRFLAAHGDMVARFHPVADASETAGDAQVSAVESSAQARECSGADPARPRRLLLPLVGATRLRGVLDLDMPDLSSADAPGRQQLLEMVAGLMAGALERLHYLDVAARTQAEVESERLRNALLASLSHDLRTPLTVLHGRAEALRDAAQGQPELERAADRVCEEAMRASRLCEGLLDLARLGVAQRLLRPEWVALEELVGAALASLGGARGGTAIVVDFAPDLPWLQLDALMFERVIANLVDNAFKQGGESQRIHIEARSDASAVTLIVGNTGSRFPAAPQPLLDAFVRGEQADSNAGFGLGLAICKAVVDAHGGTISLGNRGDAAEVRIRLPLPVEPMPGLPDTGEASDR